jgi:hypothetical protein
MGQTMYASFTEVKMARRAAGALLDHGLDESNLSLITRHTSLHAEDKEEEPEGAEKSVKHGLTATTEEDAVSGAKKGALVGLGIGAIATIASIVVPGFGLVAGGGALATAIAGGLGATAGGAVAGGVMGYLQDQGVESHVAEEYARDVENEGALIAVEVPSGKVDISTAQEIFAKYAGRNVHIQEPMPVV